jgi:hypothetical protein
LLRIISKAFTTKDDLPHLLLQRYRLAQHQPKSDTPSILEPITTVLEKSESAIANEWDAAKGTWRDSLEIVGSIAITTHIKPKYLVVITDLSHQIWALANTAIARNAQALQDLQTYLKRS